MAPSLRFVLNGAPVSVDGVAPQTTLLAWLRERGLTGTKEGCAEGDCGACTVVLAERAGEGLAWKPVNACIRLLPTVASRAVFTVESLASPSGLHPVQQAMVDCHGSQCGFCTPGFVMSLFGVYKNNATPLGRPAIDDALSGNLCRCTGYRPILEAARHMYALPAPGGWRGPTSSDDERELVRTLAALEADECDYNAAGQRYHAPRSEAELGALLAAEPDAQLVAGATDVGLWVTKELRSLGTLVWTGNVTSLRAIHADADRISVGAAASLEDAFRVLCEDYPELRETWQRFASPPIRHSGTLGGNVVNGSPIGDSMPVLIALGATVALRGKAGERELPLDSFSTGYRRNALAGGEYLACIRVPRRPPGLLLRAWKISKRYDQDISSVFAAFALRIERGAVAAARIGCGGVGPMPMRALRTEVALVGQPWSEAAARAAADVIATEFVPIDDMRASARYRVEVLSGLLHRLWLDASAHPAPLSIHDPSLERA